MADISQDLSNPISATYKDLLFINNDLVLTSDVNSAGTDNVLQDILQRLSFFRGEWFMDNTQGVPYFEQILVKNPNQANIDAILVNIIMSTPGVQSLLAYSFEPNNEKRSLSVSFSVVTTQGKVSYSTVVPVGGTS